MRILGIAAWCRDAAAALVNNGVVVAAAEEERFSRMRHDASFPAHSVAYCLRESGLSLNDIDAIVFCNKSTTNLTGFLNGARSNPFGAGLFLASGVLKNDEQSFGPQKAKNALRQLDPEFRPSKSHILFADQRLARMGAAFFTSPFEKAAVLNLDDAVQGLPLQLGSVTGTEVKLLSEQACPHTAGFLYAALASFLGFHTGAAKTAKAHKLMELAAYGDEVSEEFKRFRNTIRTELVTIEKNGEIRLNKSYFRFGKVKKPFIERKWTEVFDLHSRKEDTRLSMHYCNLALAGQRVLEEIIIRTARRLRRESGLANLCISAGSFINSMANASLLRENIFERIYVQPATSNAALAIGAALAVCHKEFECPREYHSQNRMLNSGLGPAFNSSDIAEMAREQKAVYSTQDDPEGLLDLVSQAIADGKTVGWFQGRMEYGHHALGNRCILADPRSAEVPMRLNYRIKYRDSFRPFSPAIMREHAADYFELECSSPNLEFSALLRQRFQCVTPWNYNSLSLKEKLHTPRSQFPAVTHVDFRARLQTVDKQDHPVFHALLSSFYAKTSCPMLLSTTFHLAGEPIVCSPLDAWNAFMQSDLDLLVIENFLFRKKDQLPDGNIPEGHLSS